jgi:chemotaxis protein MotD
VSSVNPEAAVAPSFYAARPKSPQAGPSTSADFAHLVDLNADADSNQPAPPRDAPAARADEARPAHPDDQPPATGVHKHAHHPKKAESPDKTATQDGDGDGAQADADQSVITQTITADGSAGALVPAAVVIPVVIASTDTAATPATGEETAAPAITANAQAATIVAAEVSASKTNNGQTIDPATGLPVAPATEATSENTAATAQTTTEAELPLPAETVIAPATTKIAAPNASAVKVKTTSGDKPATTDSAATTDAPAPAAAKSTDTVASPDAKATPQDQHEASGSTPAARTEASETKADAPEAKPASTAATAPASTPAHTHAAAPQPAAVDPVQLGNAALPLQQPAQTASTQSFAAPAPQLNVAVAANNMVPVSGLAVDIALKAAAGNSRFEIRLDPAELGRIDVRLDVDKHGQVTSHLTVERPATLDMLRRDATQLQQALENAGLKTGDGGLQFSLRDQSFAGRDDNGQSGRNAQRLIISEDTTVPAQVAGMSYGRALGSSTGVDIRI